MIENDLIFGPQKQKVGGFVVYVDQVN